MRAPHWISPLGPFTIRGSCGTGPTSGKLPLGLCGQTPSEPGGIGHRFKPSDVGRWMPSVTWVKRMRQVESLILQVRHFVLLHDERRQRDPVGGAYIGVSVSFSVAGPHPEPPAGQRQARVVLFMLSLFFVPLVVAVPAVATAPALIVVGALMMRGAREIEWASIDDSLPAFLTVAAMPFSYSIANGISLGIVS